VSPAEIAKAVRVRLAAEIEGDRLALGRLTRSIAELRAKSGAAELESMRALALAFLAFQLERFYTAVESILTRTLRTLDGDVPGGPEWHQELLRAASVPIEGLRPAVIPQTAVAPLRELLGSRHYARHGYDVPPEVRRVDELADLAKEVHGVLDASLAALEGSLRSPV
jgi:hypothetical protein